MVCSVGHVFFLTKSSTNDNCPFQILLNSISNCCHEKTQIFTLISENMIRNSQTLVRTANTTGYTVQNLLLLHVDATGAHEVGVHGTHHQYSCTLFILYIYRSTVVSEQQNLFSLTHFRVQNTLHSAQYCFNTIYGISIAHSRFRGSVNCGDPSMENRC